MFFVGSRARGPLGPSSRGRFELPTDCRCIRLMAVSRNSVVHLITGVAIAQHIMDVV